MTFEIYDGRVQGETNRQSSVKPLHPFLNLVFRGLQNVMAFLSINAYRFALWIGVSKECARFLLLETATTKLYMTGSIRSWIHYCKVRLEEHTQKEHRDIATVAYEVMKEQLPNMVTAMDQYFD
jgi:thymidylate synthase (FAD)